MKYQKLLKKLLKEYRDNIDEIKEIRRAMWSLNDEAEKYAGLNSDRFDDIQARWEDQQLFYMDAVMSLRHEIEVELHYTSKSRKEIQEGMDKFWELAFSD